MKQVTERDITVRIRTKHPHEDWAALVSDALNSRSVAGKGRIIDVSSSEPTESMEQNVIHWAQERGIFDKATPHSQHGKTLEEVQELTDALAANDVSEIKDAIGDIAVTLIIQAHMHGWTLAECLSAAWSEIKDRKGQMVDGVFVKEG